MSDSRTTFPQTFAQNPLGSEEIKRFYGKYRGEVTANVDELGLHRVKVKVANVPSADDSWAMPCLPYSGRGVGFYTIPPVGASIWVEFEGGNPNFPIWSGCFWDELELNEPRETNPIDPPMAKLLQTESCKLLLNDTDVEGGITMEVEDPAVETPVILKFSTAGAEIKTGISSLMMTPEGVITIKAGETVITLSAEEGINMTGPNITGEAETDIEFSAGAAMELEAGADLEASAGGAIEIDAGGDVEIGAGGAAELNGGGDVEIGAGGAMEINSGLDLEVAAGLAMEINTGLDLEMAAGLGVQVTAVGDIALTSISIMQTALVEVNGDLLIDGQQPLVV